MHRIHSARVEYGSYHYAHSVYGQLVGTISVWLVCSFNGETNDLSPFDFEYYNTVLESIEGVILADTHVLTREVLGTALANEDVPSFYHFCKFLDTESLTFGLATVLPDYLHLLYCHVCKYFLVYQQSF